jgi:xanthine dehydrogenase YagR molybdenum-binding subunit
MAPVTGLPLDRRDGRLKVTGRAKYAAEFEIDNLVHAVVVQSTIPSGTIAGFDLAAAQAAPGVLTILTPDNAPRLQPANEGTNLTAPEVLRIPLLQDNGVYYNGQHIAVVVADTLERARHAASLVKVSYREGEAQIRLADALAEAYPPKHFRNGARPPDSRRGDPEAALAAAPVRIEAEYATPTEHHNPMELHATTALWEGEGENQRLTVYNATQYISGTQQTLAKLFALKPEQIRVICPFTGGGFGSKGSTWPHVALAAMAARAVGRPVKLILDRRQLFSSTGHRPETIQKLRIGAGSDGRLLAMTHDVWSQMSPPVIGEFSEPAGLITEMLYACPNVAVTHRLVPTNRPLPTYMRAPGEAPGSFALESALDELGATVKLDPLELRLLNYTDTDPHEDKPYTSKALRQCYAAGAEAFGWSRRTAEPGSMRDGDTLIGWGMATATRPANWQEAGVRLVFTGDGNVTVQTGSHEIGTGTYTIVAQMVADALRVPVHRIHVELGDTRFPKAPISAGSLTAASLAAAILAAAEDAKQRLFRLALQTGRSPLAGFADTDLALADGFVMARSAPHTRIAIPALLARNGMDRLAATGTAKPGADRKDFSSHGFGAHFAEVRVDPELGQVRVSRWVAAMSAGRILNAKTARSQVIGAIGFGIGMALMEQTRLDPHTGRVTNANLSEYLVPVNADVPEIATIFVEEQDRRTNPAGVKGIGETPMCGVAGAIANAVWHATGIRVRRLPITVETLLV